MGSIEVTEPLWRKGAGIEWPFSAVAEVSCRCSSLPIWFYPGGTQLAVIELKLLHESLDRTLAQGLRQTWDYLDRCGAEEGHLVIFDRTPGKSWEEKLFQRQSSIHGKTIQVWGM